MTASEHLALGYREARQRFIDAAAQSNARTSEFVHPDHRGPEEEVLAIDVAEVGPPDAEAALVIFSGTHGVEGYAGSALQSHWLEQDTGQRPSAVRVVLVHGFNPYGFAWHRRSNEDNVDLNRNFIDWSTAPPDNSDYAALAPLLVPQKWDEVSQSETTAALIELAAELGLDRMQAIISGGQFDHVAGVFYGGTGPVWSHRWLVENLPAIVGEVKKLGLVDLHTGLGPWGVGELIVHQAKTDPVYQRAQAWWGEVYSMRDGDSVSAPMSGDWIGRVGQLVSNAELTGAALEFGTVDEISVLQALRAEAWVHSFSNRLSPEAEVARAQVRPAFVDDDPAWLEALTSRFDEVVDQAFAGLSVQV